MNAEVLFLGETALNSVNFLFLLSSVENYLTLSYMSLHLKIPFKVYAVDLLTLHSQSTALKVMSEQSLSITGTFSG